MTVGRYLLNWALWLSEGLNVLTGGAPHETLSERSGKAMLDGKRWPCVLCRFLDIFERDHCVKSIYRD